MHRAAEKGHCHIVKYLLQDPNVMVNVQDALGLTPIGVAIEAGHADMVRTLLSELECKVCTSRSYTMLLARAARCGHYSIWSTLSEFGTEQGFEGLSQTTLQDMALLAMENDHVDMIAKLLTNVSLGASVKLRLFENAIGLYSDRLVPVLLNTIGYPAWNDLQDLLQLAAHRPSTTVLLHILNDAAIRLPDKYVFPRLCDRAAYKGNLPALRLFIAYPVKTRYQYRPDLYTGNRITFEQLAFSEGVRGNQVAVVEFLLLTYSDHIVVNANIYVGARDEYSYSALTLVMRRGDHAMLNALLSLSPDISLDFRSGTMEAALGDVVARRDRSMYHTLLSTKRMVPNEPWTEKLQSQSEGDLWGFRFSRITKEEDQEVFTFFDVELGRKKLVVPELKLRAFHDYDEWSASNRSFSPS
ncbi:hypothetical protein TI39_contig4112g00036 [Zymoseptoria brevis]|uniref:Uncharacterized protein n=1 Tax=Zymoseptoria brevis TaxID=1047168 RepID=A0A0F4GGV1_9PEZI|nr:hypothetical protein TI39_contig4112g00036 [Zymoseptoria brevis]